MSWYRWRTAVLLLDCTLKPRASANQVVGLRNGRLLVEVKAPPVDGKANRALCELLAAEFHVARQRAELVSGSRSRQKTVALHQPGPAPAWFGELDPRHAASEL